MQSWNLDPETGDYIMEGGDPQETDSLQIPAYIRLKTKRQKWLYAPDDKYGSDYYSVAKRPASNSNKLLENIGAKALQPLLDDGRANSVDVNVNFNNRNNSGLQIKIVDASGEIETQTFNSLGV